VKTKRDALLVVHGVICTQTAEPSTLIAQYTCTEFELELLLRFTGGNM